MDLQRLGIEIRDARRARGLSQRDLAAAVGISPNTVSAIERGDPGQPRKLEQVMTFLGVKPLAERPVSQDVELVVRAIGIWLENLPDEERPAAVHRVIRAIASDLPRTEPSHDGSRRSVVALRLH